MSAPIKPDMLCWLVRLDDPYKWLNGTVVVTGRFLGEYRHERSRRTTRSGFLWLTKTVHVDYTLVRDAWEFSTRDGKLSGQVSAGCLRPLHDPDADLTERTDALHDSLLEFLATRYAPTEAA